MIRRRALSSMRRASLRTPGKLMKVSLIFTLLFKSGSHETDIDFCKSVVTKRLKVGAERGSRAHTTLRSTDFKPDSSVVTYWYYARPSRFAPKVVNAVLQSDA